jgi:hypothetical protein
VRQTGQGAKIARWRLTRAHINPGETLPLKALLMTGGAGITVDAASLEQGAKKMGII